MEALLAITDIRRATIKRFCLNSLDITETAESGP